MPLSSPGKPIRHTALVCACLASLVGAGSAWADGGSTTPASSGGTAFVPPLPPPESAMIVDGRAIDRGYDCSGSVSYALHGGRFLRAPLPSGALMDWGRSGPGSWITVYAHSGHAYLVVAGLRFDTSMRDDPSLCPEGVRPLQCSLWHALQAPARSQVFSRASWR